MKSQTGRREPQSTDPDSQSLIGRPWGGGMRQESVGRSGEPSGDGCDNWPQGAPFEEFRRESGAEVERASPPWARLVFAVLAVAIASLLYFLTNSPLFRIRHVEVVGAHFLSESAVARAANLEGLNIFRGSSAAVEDQVLDLGVPLRVVAFYVLPDTAVISIVERRPSYLWKVDQTLYLVSDDGTILGPTTVENQRVIVVDLDRRPVAVGQKINLGILQAAARVADALPQVMGDPPRYLLHRDDLGLIIPTSTIPQVILGDDNLDPKLSILGPVLRAAESSQPPPSEIDLRLPEHPYFR